MTLPPGTLESGSTYTAPLVEAVKRFQGRHGLEADGVIGAGTIRALNVPLAQRVRQIELAMERMRWLPALEQSPNVFVNVPLFRLWAHRSGHRRRTAAHERRRRQVARPQDADLRRPDGVRDLPARTGTRRAASRSRRSCRTRGAIRPIWPREPLEIVASGEDNAPSLPADAGEPVAVVAGKLRMRQKPGPANSLGLAKFIFPNDDNVYMHGTPAQQLFSRARRDFSHGCIRLEDPARLAEWVLRDQPDGRRAYRAAMQGERPTAREPEAAAHRSCSSTTPST